MFKNICFVSLVMLFSWIGLSAAGPGNVNTGLQIWFDANALGLSDGATINSWTDMSGNNKHAVQDTLAYRPKFRTNIYNGKPAIVFDGSNDYLTFDGNIVVNTNYSIIAVLRRATGATAHHCFLGGTKTSQHKNLHIGWQTNSTFYHAQYSNDYAMRVSNYTSGEQPIIVSLRHSNVLGNDTYIDGGLRGLDMTTSRLTHLLEWNGAAIGRYTDGSINPRFNGWIAELIFYNRYLSETERKAVEGYLSSKYNISIGNTESPEHYTDIARLSVTATIGNSDTQASGGLSVKGTSTGTASGIRIGHNNALSFTSAHNPDAVNYPNFLRLNREWFFEVSGNLNTTFSFNINSFGLGSITPGGSSYRLLFRNDTKNNFSIITGSPTINGSVISFTFNALTAVTHNGFYTLGTLDYQDSTLPVELSSFTATVTQQNFVMLKWTTQSETNVSGYYIFRNNTNDMGTAIRINSFIEATNTATETDYSFTDNEVNENTTWYYWLQHIDLNGESGFHGPISVTLSNNNNDIPPVIPITTQLSSIYSNPFSDKAIISYALAKTERVTIAVYNTKGIKVRNLVSESHNTGTWRTSWNGRDDNGQQCSNGIYFIKMIAGKYTSTRKAVLTK